MTIARVCVELDDVLERLAMAELRLQWIRELCDDRKYVGVDDILNTLNK